MLGLVRSAAEDDPRLKRKAEFMARHRRDYGYGGRLDRLRSTHFSRLRGSVYLDHAGATLYSEQQLRAATEHLAQTLYGNPHSQSPSSANATKMVAAVRQQVLNFFNASAKDYSVVFTGGATAGLKLVGECFPWTSESEFRYALKSHNSVVGIREYALEKGASFKVVEMEEEEEEWRKHGDAGDRGAPDNSARNYSLFAFPGECNFSGAKHSLEWVTRYHDKRGENRTWLVLVDAAALAANTPIDLTKYPADFVVTSFYKIFGYPTGIGALLVRNGITRICDSESAALLNKTFFGGGTVEASLSTERYHVLRKSASERFEDGTVPFTSIVALKFGLDTLLEGPAPGGMANIQRHTFCLAQYLHAQLAELRHYNGAPAAVIYGRHHLKDSSQQGPIVAFNLRKASGEWVGYKEVEQLAGMENIHIRTGCFCNPGACHYYLGLTSAQVKQNLAAGHVCWDGHDVMNGKPTGAIRASIGYMTSWEDIDTFLSFLKKYFVETAPVLATVGALSSEAHKELDLRLSGLFVYPIKSCKGFEIGGEWEIGDHGFVYDREWMIVDETGSGITQKKVSKLCQIQPLVDREQGKLHIDAPGMERLSLDLARFPDEEIALDVCGDAGAGRLYGDEEVKEWCTLVRKSPTKLRKAGRSRGGQTEDEAEGPRREIAFANEGQFLLVSENSVDDLNLRLRAKASPLQMEATRFRPNIILQRTPSLPPYAEDAIAGIMIGNQVFNALGLCGRCRMVGINQATGTFDKEPLLTLASYRRNSGMIMFGLQLAHDKERSPQPHVVSLAAPVRILKEES